MQLSAVGELMIYVITFRRMSADVCIFKFKRPKSRRCDPEHKVAIGIVCEYKRNI